MVLVRLREQYLLLCCCIRLLYKSNSTKAALYQTFYKAVKFFEKFVKIVIYVAHHTLFISYLCITLCGEDLFVINNTAQI